MITQLGGVESINPKVIEGLFASDLSYLQDFYNRINHNGAAGMKVTCPHCHQSFEAEDRSPGES